MSRTRIKICGLTDLSEATWLAQSGADCIGLNFWPRSKRYVSFEQGRQLVDALRASGPESLRVVGLFVNAEMEHIRRCVAETGIDRIQLHGDESPAFAKELGEACGMAIGLAGEDDVARFESFDCAWMLVDSKSEGRGGSGIAADFSLAARCARLHRETWLAGGLRPGNVADAIGKVRPYGVDVASGVESSPGRKDPQKVRAFIEAVAQADLALAADADKAREKTP